MSVVFSQNSMNEMFVILFKQILMNVKNCLDFAKEENVLIHLVASSVSVHQGTIWMKRLECVMVRSLHLTSLLLLFLENDDRSKCRRINVCLKRNISRPSSVKLKSGKIASKQRKFLLDHFEIYANFCLQWSDFDQNQKTQQFFFK